MRDVVQADVPSIRCKPVQRLPSLSRRFCLRGRSQARALQVSAMSIEPVIFGHRANLANQTHLPPCMSRSVAQNQRDLPSLVGSPLLSDRGDLTRCSRFSLVPDPANGPAQSTRPPNTSPNPSGNTGSQGESMVTGMLRRLFGPSGTDSTPTSPTGADAPNNTASPSSTTATAGPGSSFRPSSSRQPSGPPGPTPNPNPQGVPYGSSPYRPLNRDSIASNASGAYHSAAPPTDRASERRPAEAPRERVPTDELNRAIPEEYRARHRQRERDRQHELP